MTDDAGAISRARDRKIGLGMLSTRFQRFEVSVGGKQRGPDALSKDPSLFSAVPQPPGHTDRPVHRSEYARFFPGCNKGAPTSRRTLQRLIAHKKRQSHVLAHAAKNPARMAVPLSKQVLAMCEEHGIEPNALMREAAHPLRDYTHVIHSSYTPSWEYADGGIERFDAEVAGATPKSAPARPTRRSPRVRPTPPKPALPPDPALEEKVANLERKRLESLHRLAAVRLAVQRGHERAAQRELQVCSSAPPSYWVLPGTVTTPSLACFYVRSTLVASSLAWRH